MSKSKSDSKVAKPAKSDVLTKVKSASVAKPAQTVKSKSKDVAKEVAVKEDKKSKKNKKVKEPTPEPSSESEAESASSDSSSEEEVEVKKPVANGKANGTKKDAAESSDEDSDESDSSEDEATPATGVLGKATPVDAIEADSSDDNASDSDDESSEDEKPAQKATKVDTKKAAKDDSDDESSDDSASEASEAEVEVKTTKRKAEDAVEPSAKKTKTTVDTSKGANLFVGNLSWNVDEAWLRETFEEHGTLTAVRLMTDRDTGRSKGFGYVEFESAEDAAKAHAAKQGFELDNRALNVDFANARPDNKDKQENRRKSYGDQVSEPSDTLFIGNLSFDVGQEQVSEAFAPYGTIMSVRLPTDRETGQPKGFGYVTFSSIEEAKGSLEAMQGGYVGSRPIRLDYSTPRPANDSPAGGRGRGGFGGRGGGRGGFGDRGGRGGRGRGGFGDRGGRGGRGGSRGGSTNRGGFGDFSGHKQKFDE